MRGGDRKSKPIEELKASGTFRKDRHASRLETRVPALEKAPPPPAWFDKEHTDKWNEVCANLLEFGIMATQDLDAIKTYVCTTIAQSNAWKSVIEDGIIVGDKENPALKIYRDMEQIVKPLREQFGFTPRSRQGINIKPAETKKADPLAAILGGEAIAKRKSG